MATDKDQGDNGEFTYQLNDPEGAFAIDPRTGWLTVRNQVIRIDANVESKSSMSGSLMRVLQIELSAVGVLKCAVGNPIRSRQNTIGIR